MGVQPAGRTSRTASERLGAESAAVAQQFVSEAIAKNLQGKDAPNSKVKIDGHSKSDTVLQNAILYLAERMLYRIGLHAELE